MAVWEINVVEVNARSQKVIKIPRGQKKSRRKKNNQPRSFTISKNGVVVEGFRPDDEKSYSECVTFLEKWCDQIDDTIIDRSIPTGVNGNSNKEVTIYEFFSGSGRLR